MCSLDKIENIFLLKRNLEFLEPCQILIFECSSMMMSFLISNVANNRIQLRMAVRKRAIAFLPTEPSTNPPFLVDEVRRVRLDIPNEVSQCHCRFQSDQDVNVIGHAIDGDQFLSAVCNYAGYV